MSYQYLGETSQERTRRLEDEARARKWQLQDEDRAMAAQKDYDEAHKYDAIYAQSAALAAPRARANVDYSSMMQSGAAYGVPRGPGGISRAVSGVGQGILIFGILGGGLLVMLMLFFMLKPKTVSQMPAMFAGQSNWRPKKNRRKKRK